jgi:hypothetical protein
MQFGFRSRLPYAVNLQHTERVTFVYRPTKQMPREPRRLD